MDNGIVHQVVEHPIIEKGPVVDKASLAEKEKIPLIYILEGILQDRAKKSKVLGKKKRSIGNENGDVPLVSQQPVAEVQPEVGESPKDIPLIDKESLRRKNHSLTIWKGFLRVKLIVQDEEKKKKKQ